MARSSTLVALLLVAGTVALAPMAAEAQRMGAGGRSPGFSGTSSRGFHHGAPGARGFGHRRFGSVVVFAPPLFWYGSDWYGFDPGYAAAPVYAPTYAPPVAYAPSPSVTLAPPAPTAPPPPSVVELPTGRWDLRGDGISAPYRWVWIPNPPTAPPSGPPGGAPAAPGPSSRPDPPGHTRVYRWTDADGTLHLTDRLDQVPERYRARAAKPS